MKIWRPTKHAVAKMTARDVAWAEVMEVLQRPEVVYRDTRRSPRQQVMQRGDLAVVVDPADGAVITVLLRSDQQWDDADARGRR